jgi:hypothetical protein
VIDATAGENGGGRDETSAPADKPLDKPPDDKASAPFFTGSITFVALSIPSIALLLTDRVYGISYLRVTMGFLVGLAVAMMVVACIAAFLALLRLSGWWNAPIGLIAAILAVLIVLAPLITISLILEYA